MPTKKITLNSVKDIKPSETLWDTDTTGFGCRCQQQDKIFVVKYRVGSGRAARQRFYKIGKLGAPWTPDTARDEAKRILGLVSQGKDPASEREKDRTSPDMNEAFDLFMKHGQGKRGERTLNEYRRMYDRMVKVTLGKYRVKDIIAADISRLHIANAHIAPQANRLLQMLSAFLNWCERQEYRDQGTNPCRFIEKYKEKSRERFLSEEELFCLSQAMSQYEERYRFLKEQSHKKHKSGETEENAVTQYVTAAIRLLLFTGARRNEILDLKWGDVDFQNRLIRLQESKTGQKTIYLSAPALMILSELPQIEGNPYVICGKKNGTRLVNIKDPWKRICRLATLNLWERQTHLASLISNLKVKTPETQTEAELFDAVQSEAKKEKLKLSIGLMDVHIHDLRHNYASTAVITGHHLKVVGSLLGHADTKTTERYAHLANDPLQTANEAISNKILQAMTYKNDLNKVADFKAGKKQ